MLRKAKNYLEGWLKFRVQQLTILVRSHYVFKSAIIHFDHIFVAWLSILPNQSLDIELIAN